MSFDRHLASSQSHQSLDPSGACPPAGLLASKGRSAPTAGKASRNRRRQLASLGLAAAVAAPVAALLPKLFAGRSMANGEVAQAAPADAPAAPTSDADLYKLGQDQFKNGQYEEAAETLSKVNTAALPDADRAQVIQTIADARKAAEQRVIARNDFLQGEEARKSSQPIMAVSHYKAALANQYIDNDTKDKATAQLALVAGGEAPAAAPATTEPAAPALAVSPATLPAALADNNPPAAPAAPVIPASGVPSLSPRESYIVGKAEYNGGDYKSARRNFRVAAAAGYKPPLAQDPPEVYLNRLDAMDQQTQASHQRLADSGQQPVVGAAVTPATAPAVAPPAVAAEAGPSPATAPAVAPPAVAAEAGPSPATAPAVAPPAVAAEAGPSPATPPAVAPPAVAAEAGTAQPSTPGVSPSSPLPSPDRQTQALHDLQATAQLIDIQHQADAYQARVLVTEAKKAQDANDYARARDLYLQAVALDPKNQAAIEGRNEMLMYLGQSPENANVEESRVKTSIDAERQQILYDYNSALAAANDAIGRADFATADAESEKARAAAYQNQGIFSQAEVRQFNTKLTDLKLRIEQARADAIRKADQERADTVAKQLRIEAENARRNRERTVADLIAKARQLTDNAQYREAIGVVDQILILEPRNDYAIGVRPLLIDKDSTFEQRQFRERDDFEIQKALNSAEEKKIPYDDILRYPSDWPDLSALRDQTLAAERGINADERAVQAQLDRKLPEVKFDGVGFSDVIDFLRDVSGANIFVNWKALEAAGIDKNAPVTARLFNVKFSKALQVILDSVSTAQAKVGYTIDDGVITISSGDDLNKNVITRVYDIRDLIINVPDFTDAPKFDLASSTQQSQSGQGGGGGGGGGASSGLFGGAGGTAIKETGKTRDQLVDDITKLIQETVASDSWKETGGQVGAIKELSGQLVVTQTPENHRQLVNLLEQLRETKSIQVTVETRFLTIQRNFLEDVGVDLDFVLNATGNISKSLSPIQINQDSSTYTLGPSTSVPGTIGKTATALTTAATYLDDFQVNLLLRATQAQQFSTIVTAPRLTLFNGQRAYVLVATEQAYVSNLEASVGTGSSSFQPEVSIVQSGVSLDVQATVSADRKYVTLTLRPQLSTLLNLREFTFQNGQNAAPAAGATTPVIIGGTTGVAPTGIIQTPEIQITQVKTTVSVPDGGTLLLGGQTIAGEIEKEAGVPILSKIPGLDRLFTNRSMAKDEQILLILCKPTIIIQKEVEQKQFPLLSTKLTGQ